MKKMVFLWNVLQVIFYKFLAELPKFPFWVADWALRFNYKQFRDSSEISYFPKVLRIKSLGNLWGNSCTPSMVILT